MLKGILLFELNEVPFRVLDNFCNQNNNSAFAQLLSRCHQFTTYTVDDHGDGDLHPWLANLGVPIPSYMAKSRLAASPGLLAQVTLGAGEA